MNEDWKNAFGILMCREICDGTGARICEGAPSTCSSCKMGCHYKIKTIMVTVYILVIRLITSHLIWIYTVCKGICFGLLGRNLCYYDSFHHSNSLILYKTTIRGATLYSKFYNFITIKIFNLQMDKCFYVSTVTHNAY